MRKLASIQRVLNVRPIEGADKIEAVDVLGWTVVCKKGEFKVGDQCVYFEIDSWLDSSNPAFAIFEERFTNWGTKRGMRLKTIKLRKQISQGLILKTSAFPEITMPEFGRQFGRQSPVFTEGDDLTEILNIELWEPLEEQREKNGGVNKTAGAGKFPSFLRKTDQERVQNYMHELGKHSEETFEVTIKLDGSSMTVYHLNKSSPHFAHVQEDIEKRALRKKSFLHRLLFKAKKRLGLAKSPDFYQGVCSRNMELGIDEGNHFSTYVREHGILEKLKQGLLSTENYAFQGELIAPTIQNNHEQVKGFEFYVFDVFDTDRQEYLLPSVARMVTKGVGLKYVPVLEESIGLENFGLGSLLTPREVVDQILEQAEGPGMNPGVKREGIVMKSNSTQFSFKAISNAYLLHKDGKS